MQWSGQVPSQVRFSVQKMVVTHGSSVPRFKIFRLALLFPGAFPRVRIHIMSAGSNLILLIRHAFLLLLNRGASWSVVIMASRGKITKKKRKSTGIRLPLTNWLLDGSTRQVALVLL